MKNRIKAALLLAATGTTLYCNAPAGKPEGLEGKKAELQRLKTEQVKIAESISRLEGEIAKLDTTSVVKAVKTVEVDTLRNGAFLHYIDLQGKIDAEDISYVTPRGMGGQVKALFIKKGDKVSKGQLILKLEDGVMQQNIKQLQSQYDFANNIYERQKNLWEKGIGTEVQYLTAKNNVDALQKQIDVVKEQLATTNVYAQVDGVADEVNIRTGELFQGVTAAGPQVRIVNTSRLKATVDIPENYISKINKGSKVVVSIPDLAKDITATLSVVSQTINPNTRGFLAEIKLPKDAQLKPNQLALVHILDYSNPSVLSIPVNMLQADERGKYVYVVEKQGERQVARKKTIQTGESYQGLIEIRSGLSDGDLLVTAGYQNLYEGQLVQAEK
ncbi:MAG: hypothetical protein RL732_1638 [Bacteroidota bacterium]